jgi:membrane protein DedA with SNARE-associated domain
MDGGAGIFAIFGILVICGLGFPMPEDIPLLAAGYLAYIGETTVLTACIVCLLGVLIGDTIIFYVGRHLGVRLFRSRLAMAITTPERIEKVEGYYHKYGTKIIFFGRFTAGFRSPVFFVAGALKIPYRRFLFLDGVAACVSVPLWIFLGDHFGEEIDTFLHWVHRAKNIFYVIVGAVIAIIVGILVYKAQRTKRNLETGKKEARKKHFVPDA